MQLHPTSIDRLELIVSETDLNIEYGLIITPMSAMQHGSNACGITNWKEVDVAAVYLLLELLDGERLSQLRIGSDRCLTENHSQQEVRR